MNEEEAKNWVKDKSNQAAIVQRFLDTYQPKKAKVALFMAGIPGAGKTEFAENLYRGSRETAVSFTPIEHDKLVEHIDGYAPENYYNYRKAGSVLVTRIFNECISNGYGFIFDGTLSHANGIRNVGKALEADYAVAIIYIMQDANAAWELTQAREIVKKRAIDKAGFIETCNKINNNLYQIFKTFGKNPKFQFLIFNKQGAPGMENATAIVHGAGFDNSTEIEKVLKTSYNCKVLE